MYGTGNSHFLWRCSAIARLKTARKCLILVLIVFIESFCSLIHISYFFRWLATSDIWKRNISRCLLNLIKDRKVGYLKHACISVFFFLLASFGCKWGNIHLLSYCWYWGLVLVASTSVAAVKFFPAILLFKATFCISVIFSFMRMVILSTIWTFGFWLVSPWNPIALLLWIRQDLFGTSVFRLYRHITWEDVHHY